MLTEEGTHQKVVVLLGTPRRVEADHWLCPFLIQGIVDSGVEYSHGGDSMQSLLLAVQGIRWHLERSGRHLVWGEVSPEIPRLVPGFRGKEFEKRVDLAIDREVKRHEMGIFRARKAEIRRAEAELRALKKGTARWQEPAGRAELKAKIIQQERRIRRAKLYIARWEASLRKWKPFLDSDR